MSLKFKFVTSGQHVDDAAVFTQVLNGVAQKPLAPANVKGYTSARRNFGSPAFNIGNIGIEWTRRSRIASGMRPFSGVPIAEEIQRYEVEIMDGATVKRTISVLPADPMPLLWCEIARGGAWIDWDETISHTVNLSTVVYVSEQVFHANNEDFQCTFFANTSVSNIFPRYVGIAPVSVLNPGVYATWLPSIGFERSALPPFTMGLTTEIQLASSAKSQLVIKVQRGLATLYQDPVGNFGAPLGSESIPISGDWRMIVREPSVTEDFYVSQPRCFRSESPSCVYFYNDMITDFGSEQSSLKVRVYQVSAIVGRGPYAEATIQIPTNTFRAVA